MEWPGPRQGWMDKLGGTRRQCYTVKQVRTHMGGRRSACSCSLGRLGQLGAPAQLAYAAARCARRARTAAASSCSGALAMRATMYASTAIASTSALAAE